MASGPDVWVNVEPSPISLSGRNLALDLRLISRLGVQLALVSARCARQSFALQSPVTHVGQSLALVGRPLALIGEALALVRAALAVVGKSLSPIRVPPPQLQVFSLHVEPLDGVFASSSQRLTLGGHSLAFLGNSLAFTCCGEQFVQLVPARVGAGRSLARSVVRRNCDQIL